MPRILFMSKYGVKAASCRYRFVQFFPYLEKHGIECTLSPLFDDDYLEHKFTTGRASIADIVHSFSRRLCAISRASSFDLVVLHCEAFPYLPSIFEKILKLINVPYVFDFDDAIFHNYDLHRNLLIRWLLGNKIKTVVSNASLVIAGNDYLANYARSVNSVVRILPTVVDLDRYTVARSVNKNSGRFTIGWIGSPTTSVYVDDILPALDCFCERSESIVMLVGAQDNYSRHGKFQVTPWSMHTEVTDIQQFDVGIMPLPDTPWARGKCGFKLIQYMACGIPVIASPVGINREIIDHGVNGFLAETQEEWVNSLEVLRSDPDRRRKMGDCGREMVQDRYCVQVVADRLCRTLKEVAGA